MPAQDLVKIRVGGVPEHFNTPWHEARDSGAFAAGGLEIIWTNFSTGTGAMCKEINAGRQDVIVALTEGALADIVKGGEHRILGTYVTSPLRWGVHTLAGSDMTSLESLRGSRFAISRYGSGSHLMACVLAVNQGWDPAKDLRFVVVGNMDGARAAFKAGEVDAFMWNKTTTEHLVNAGELQLVSLFPTPWPCFVVSASESFLAAHPEAAMTMMAILAKSAETFQAGGTSSQALAEARYGLTPEATAEWFNTCRWQTSPKACIAEETLMEVLSALERAGVLSPEQVIRARRCTESLVAAGITVEMPSVMYNWRVNAIMNALEERGKATGPLEVSDLVALGHLDQYHYLGTEACDHAAVTLGLGPESRVLDVGSGIGGPARYLAATTGCSVFGVELQRDLVAAAEALTARVAILDGKIQFACGDFVHMNLEEEMFDHLISLLVFLHIPARAKLFEACHRRLAPGGTFLIEDFCCLSTFTEKESEELRDVVAASSVVTTPQYRADLEAAGFVDIVFENLTPVWCAWTKARYEGFVRSKTKAVATHGEELFASRSKFYGVIAELFQGGHLGGVRITGRRPGVLETALASGRLIVGKSRRMEAKVLETGEVVDDVLSKGKELPRDEVAFGVIQPPFPAGDFHDSLQYHFFCGPITVACRVFHTSSLQHYSAWILDERSDGLLSSKGTVELLNNGCVGSMETVPCADSTLHLRSRDMEIRDTNGEGAITLCSSECGGSTIIASIEFTWTEDMVKSWEVTGQATGVIHRPRMRASVVLATHQAGVDHSEKFVGDGYSKRYYGPDYGPCWGYRFLVGLVAPGKGYKSGEQNATAVWTADATFGDNKYNYFKLITPENEFIQAESCDTWQQADCGYAIIDGNRYKLEAETIGDWWETFIENPAEKARAHNICAFHHLHLVLPIDQTLMMYLCFMRTHRLQ